MKVFMIPEDQRTALLQYLYQRPYGEVARGVQMLQSAQEVKVVDVSPDAPKQSESNELNGPVKLAPVPDAPEADKPAEPTKTPDVSAQG